jgi:hypothetical protein
MRDIIAGTTIGIGLMLLGYFGHAVLSPSPPPVQASATDDRELVARGMTILNVQSGAKVVLYPAGDFVLNAADGGVTIVQMPQPQTTQKTQKKH